MFRTIKRSAAAALAVIGLGAPGCTESEDQSGPDVLATTTIWADVTARVACSGDIEVDSVLPAGADPHDFEASLADRQLIDETSLVVANGSGLEGSLSGALDATATPVIRLADDMRTIDGDPHIWMDPDMVSAALDLIGEALIEYLDLDPSGIEGCIADYRSELAALDADNAAAVATIPAERRVLVTNHDSLSYYADRYGFVVVGSVLGSHSTVAEPSPAEIEELADEIVELGVPALFTDPGESSAEAEAVADRAGVEAIDLPTGALDPPEVATYLDLQRVTTERIVAGLSQ